MKLRVLNFLALTAFLFVSCEKGGDFDKEDYDNDKSEINDDDKDGKKDEKDCFEFVYPISYTMPDGSTISGDDEEALWGAIKEWYETHDSEEKPTLNYPIEIIFPDNDGVFEIDSEEEMKEATEGCKDDWDDKDWDKDEKDCFEFVFPISVTMPDGSTITGDNDEEVFGAIEEWYKIHDSQQEAVLNYPVQIVFPDNDMPVTINNDEELEDAEDC